MTTSTDPPIKSTLPPIPDNYYDRLEVPRQVATQDEIKKGYRKVARRVHPDSNPDPMAGDWFAAVNQAFEVLSDDSEGGKREMYDLGLPLESETDEPGAMDDMEFEVVDEGEAAGAGGQAPPGPPPAWQDPFTQQWPSSPSRGTRTAAPHATGQPFRPPTTSTPPPPNPIFTRPSSWSLSLEDGIWAGLGLALMIGFSVLTGVTWPAVPNFFGSFVHVIAAASHLSPYAWVALLLVYLAIEAGLTKGGLTKVIGAMLLAAAKGTPVMVYALYKMATNIVKLGVFTGFAVTHLVRRLRARRRQAATP